MEQTLIEQKQQYETLTKEEKIQQRHSVEITNTSNYLNARPSTLEALTKSGYCCVHYRKQRGKLSDMNASDEFGSHGCPPALKCLVFVWDELNKDFQGFVSKLMSEKENKEVTNTIPKSAATPNLNPNDVNELEFQKNKLKSKKFIDEGNTAIGAASGGADNSVWCELCDADINPGNQQNPYQQNAFTQHLKANHQGCGESARGKGYNSNGVYCEGWAGQCGEEGVGATSWYLMCEACHDKYLIPNKKSLNVNEALLARANEPKFIQPPPTVTTNLNPSLTTTFGTKKLKMNSNMSMEFFDTMKDNALFLLDLNSHNGGLLNKSAGNNLMPLKNKTNLRHSSANEFVIQPNTSNFNHRHSTNVVDENLRRASLQKQGSISNYFTKKHPANGINGANETVPDLLWTPPESITCLEILNGKLSESESCNVFSLDNEKNFFDPNMMANHHPQISAQENAASNESKFHRSFSMIQGWGIYTMNPIERDTSNHECIAGGNQVHQNNENRVIMRRKKTCLCDSSKFSSKISLTY